MQNPALQLIPVSPRLVIPSHEATRTNTHSKINHHDDNKPNTDHSRPPFLIINALDIATFADLVHAPDIQDQAVDECDGGEDGEGPCGSEGDVVNSKVEESGGDTAEDDGEFEPGEKCAFGGEMDLWFYADGDEDSCSAVRG